MTSYRSGGNCVQRTTVSKRSSPTYIDSRDGSDEGTVRSIGPASREDLPLLRDQGRNTMLTPLGIAL
jgi:hypothetical protein